MKQYIVVRTRQRIILASYWFDATGFYGINQPKNPITGNPDIPTYTQIETYPNDDRGWREVNEHCARLNRVRRKQLTRQEKTTITKAGKND